MLRGTVKWFNEKKGHGFIKKEDGTDIFVHKTNIKDAGLKGLKGGEKVEFEVTTGPRGDQAVNVTITAGPEESTDDKIKAFRKDSREKLRDLKKRMDRR